MAVTACVRRFILVVLCGNPIMKGAFVTLLNSLILQLDQEIALLTAQLGRLNVIQLLTNLTIQSLRAVFNKVQADLNLVLGPLNDASACPELLTMNSIIQRSVLSKKVRALQNALYKLNKTANLARAQTAIIAYKNKVRDDLQNMVDEIAALCP